jgi:CheY-like chemotaxis protein
MSMEERIRILIVEDDEPAAETLRKTITETLESVEIRIERNFDEASSIIQTYSYEAVVLDLFLGDPADNDKQGQKVWEQIWERKLVPIIIHTAGECDLTPDVPNNNPLLKCIKKGSGSDKKVADLLSLARPHILGLRQVEQEFNKAIHSVIEKVCPLIWQATEADEQLRSALLVRSARRRLAAMMDLNTISTDEQMLSWEQYIYPPLGDCLLMGDILRTKDGSVDDPAAYRLVLTPSCDLVMRSGKAKVRNVLVAKCKSIKEYLQAAKVGIQEVRDKLPRLLTEAQTGGYIPLPGFKSVLPCMSVRLRDLELVSIAEIGAEGTNKNFIRVASVDSPFREHLAWAYLQIAGRPGVPDRDLDKWTNDILEAVQNSSQP